MTSSIDAGLSSRRKLGVWAAAGVVAGVAAALAGLGRQAPLVGWDVAVLGWTGWTWWRLWPMDADDTAAHASREDPSRAASRVILLVASVASLVAVGVLLVVAAQAKGTRQDLLAAFAVLSVVLSWVAVHTIFALLYAEVHFTDPATGVDFPGPRPATYRDFAYLAFTIGMTYQVSDTGFQGTAIRSAALRHGLLSYLFGAVIIASTLNLVIGLGP